MTAKLDAKMCVELYERTKDRPLPFSLENVLVHFKNKEDAKNILIEAELASGANSYNQLAGKAGVNADRIMNAAGKGTMFLPDLLKIIKKEDLDRISGISKVFFNKKLEANEKIEKILNADRFMRLPEVGKKVDSLVRNGHLLRILFDVRSWRGKDSATYYWVNGDPEEEIKFVRTIMEHARKKGFPSVIKDSRNALKTFCKMTGKSEKRVIWRARKMGWEKFEQP